MGGYIFFMYTCGAIFVALASQIQINTRLIEIIIGEHTENNCFEGMGHIEEKLDEI